LEASNTFTTARLRVGHQLGKMDFPCHQTCHTVAVVVAVAMRAKPLMQWLAVTADFTEQAAAGAVALSDLRPALAATAHRGLSL
jgi:hypothetical protein